MNKQAVYYTCNSHDPAIDELCRNQLASCDIGVISVSLNKSIDFGDERIVMNGQRSPLMMHRQILAGLLASKADLVFLCENDVLYHPTHFRLEKVEQVFVYNCNVWRMRWSDGLSVWTDDLQQTSGLCAPRDLLIDFYSQRVDQIEREGNNRHYEPGIKQTVGSRQTINRLSDYPNICIRHDKNLTKSKWSPDEFRNKKYAKGWKMTYSVPGWRKENGIIRT